ncbi:MAG TPA: branched-chain amino acid ABC transporter permease, partial [Ramlibacter sp.]
MGRTKTHYTFKPLNVARYAIWSLFALALIVAPLVFTSSLALTMLSQIG